MDARLPIEVFLISCLPHPLQPPHGRGHALPVRSSYQGQSGSVYGADVVDKTSKDRTVTIMSVKKTKRLEAYVNEHIFSFLFVKIGRVFFQDDLYGRALF